MNKCEYHPAHFSKSGWHFLAQKLLIVLIQCTQSVTFFLCVCVCVCVRVHSLRLQYAVYHHAEFLKKVTSIGSNNVFKQIIPDRSRRFITLMQEFNFALSSQQCFNYKTANNSPKLPGNRILPNLSNLWSQHYTTFPKERPIMCSVVVCLLCLSVHYVCLFLLW